MADQRPIGYWLKLVDRLIDESFASTLDEHGVTRRQWQLLNVLGSGSATRAELDAAVAPFLARPADTLTVDPSEPAATAPETTVPESLTDELDELVESEWVGESPSGFVLTPRGQQSFERLSVVVGTIRASLTAGIEQAEYDATTRTLETMARNLGWTG